MRADLFVANSLKISRNKASELILDGKIEIDGRKISKASADIVNSDVNSHSRISVLGDIYVGRGAIKLNGFLERIHLDLRELNALDIGSSTGGFVQALLANGIKSVVALDVGSGQLADVLREDSRVEVRENTDIRDFALSDGRKFGLITADVSFIPLEMILKSVDVLSEFAIILLFKPQFQVGIAAKRDKRGVVKNESEIAKAKSRFERECLKLGWELKDSAECVIKGKEGNLERFYYFTKG